MVKCIQCGEQFPLKECPECGSEDVFNEYRQDGLFSRSYNECRVCGFNAYKDAPFYHRQKRCQKCRE